MKKKITKQQAKYVEERAKGKTKQASALLAGYVVDPNLDVHVEDYPTVKEQLAKVRKELAENAQITKEEVVEMLMDAARMAKVLGDPTGMVAAARELGKMLGFYAPEVKKVTHGLDKNSLRAVLDEMTDEDLIRIANSRAIEGESKVVALEAPK